MPAKELGAAIARQYEQLPAMPFPQDADVEIAADYSGQCRNVGCSIVLSEFGVRGGSSIDIIYGKIQGHDFKAALPLIEAAQYSLSDPGAYWID